MPAALVIPAGRGVVVVAIPDVLAEMLTLLRFTFRMQDSGTPTMRLVLVAPVATRFDTVML
jgi:hypothetical protein